MENKEFYFTIETNAVTELKERGSRFTGYAYPVQSPEEAKVVLANLKKEHPKATHHCFAYRLGLDGTVFRSSDAGEPSGTAGKPILGQIDSKSLTNVIVVVVRYFGGTLLGVPGLIQAYKSVAALVLQLAPSVQKAVEQRYELQFDYTIINEVMTILKKYNCSVLHQEMQLFCLLQVGIPVTREEEVMYELKQKKNISCRKV